MKKKKLLTFFFFQNKTGARRRPRLPAVEGGPAPLRQPLPDLPRRRPDLRAGAEAVRVGRGRENVSCCFFFFFRASSFEANVLSLLIFISSLPNRCYEDFVWFVLSEEDKASDVALGYWFRAVDVDGDGEKKKKKTFLVSRLRKRKKNSLSFSLKKKLQTGMLTPPEMQYFYEEQLHRMECLSQEPVAFADVLCQLHDMLSPEVRERLGIYETF